MMTLADKDKIEKMVRGCLYTDEYRDFAKHFEEIHRDEMYKKSDMTARTHNICWLVTVYLYSIADIYGDSG